MKWSIQKVYLKALACFTTYFLFQKALEIVFKKAKKKYCDTWLTPPPFECHVLFEWPLMNSNIFSLVVCSADKLLHICKDILINLEWLKVKNLTLA